jgi:hypothetical protein
MKTLRNEMFVVFKSHLAGELAENFLISLEKNRGCTTNEGLL